VRPNPIPSRFGPSGTRRSPRLMVTLLLMAALALVLVPYRTAKANPQIIVGACGGFVSDGTDAPYVPAGACGCDYLWDIVDPNGSIVASYSNPNNWSAAYDYSSDQFNVCTPATAGQGIGYEVRCVSVETGGVSGHFDIVAPTGGGGGGGGGGGCSGVTLLSPTNLTALGGNVSVSLHWFAASGASNYNVKRSLVSGGPYVTVAANIATTSYTDPNLNNGTAYYYVVTANYACGGESAPSNEATATPQLTPPAAPAYLTATPGNTRVLLSWPSSGGATGYNVKRSPSYSGTYATIAVNVSGLSYNDTGRTNGTTYYYVVTALNTAGEGPPSSVAYATPEPSDFTLSASPASLSALPGGGASSTLQVNALYDFSGTVGLTVTGAPSGVTASLSPTSVVGGGTSTLTVTLGGSVPPNTSYVLMVTATSGSLSHAVTVPLAVPDFGLAVSPTARSVPQGHARRVGVIVTSLNGFGSAISLTVSGLPAGVTASFGPNPVNGGGLSVLSLSAGAGAAPGTYGLTVTGTSGLLTHNAGLSLTIPSTAPPAAPASLTATPGDTAIFLAWIPSPGATSYNVYRGTSASGEAFTPVATGVTKPGYVDVGLTNDTTYFYVVTAVAGGSESDTSNEVSTDPEYQGSLRELPGLKANLLGAYDDCPNGSTPMSGPCQGAPSMPLGFPINFFGTSYDQVFVNNNGNVTFGMSQGRYTPKALTASDIPPILAPFFADVDTRVGLQTTWGTDTLYGHRVFGVDWIRVGYYGMHYDKHNSFQLVIVDRSDTGPGNFDFEFNYARIRWETGDASGGYNGFGGSSAHVGYADGKGINYFDAAGSGIPGAFLDSNPYTGLVSQDYRSTQLGRDRYSMRSGVIYSGASDLGDGGMTIIGAPPAPPSGLTATPGNAQVSLGWQSSPESLGCLVYRSTTSGGPYQCIGATPTFNFTDLGVTNGVTYYYVVTALGVYGESGPSNEASAMPQAPDFTLDASPPSLSILQGQSGTASVTVAPFGGFAGAVGLAVTGLPSGVTATFAPASITGSGASTLTLAVAATAMPGAYALTVTGTSGSLTHSVPLSLTIPAPVPDFSLSASPTSLNLAQGQSGTSTVTVGSLNGFSGSVSLTASGLPSGLTAGFSPVSVSGSGSSTLTLTAGNGVATGTYPVSLTGTAGSLSHTVTVSVTVRAAGSTVPVPQWAVGYQATSGFQPGPNLIDGSVGDTSTLYSVASAPTAMTVLYDLGASPATAVASVEVAWEIVNGGGPYTLDYSNDLATWTTAMGNGGGGSLASYTYPVSPAVTARYWRFSLQLSSGAPYGTMVGVSDYRLFDGSGNPVKGGGSGPDFSLSASPTSLTVAQGASGTSTVAISPLNGFTGTVSLTASGLPSGVTASLSPASLSGYAGSTLTVIVGSEVPPGAYTATVTGTSGGLTHGATVTVTVPAPDFSLSASPSVLSVAQGGRGTSTLTVSPLNGFMGSVSLSASGLPSGVTAAFSPASVAGSGSSVLTLLVGAGVPPGNYSVTVIGVSGSLTRTTAVYLTVTPPPDFGLTVAPASVTVPQNGVGASTVKVSSLNGFSGTVALTAFGLPAGVTAAFSPGSVLGSGPSTLALSVGASVAPGTYTITVTGTSGSLTHTATVALTVTTGASTPDFGVSLSPTSLNVGQGMTATDTITVSPVNGFAGSVALTATGLPAGVTAAFSPQTLSGGGTSTLTVTAATGAAAGGSTVTVTGTFNATAHSVQLPLTVSAPSFSLATDQSSLSIAQNTSGTATVTVTPASGLNEQVALGLTGMPSGLTARFSPATVSTTGGSAGISTLTLAADGTVAPGTYGLTLMGTAGTVTNKIQMTVTVSKPPFDARLIAAATGSSKITLYWSGVPNAIGYNVYRGTVAGGEDYTNPVNGSTPVTTPDNGPGTNNMFMYSDTKVTDGTEYFYTVKAVYSASERNASIEASAIPNAGAIPWDSGDPVSITAAMTTQLLAVMPADFDPGMDEYISAGVGLLAVQGPDGVMYENGADGTPAAAYASPAYYDASSGSIVDNDGSVIPAPDVDVSNTQYPSMVAGSSSPLLLRPEADPLKQDLNHDFGFQRGIERKIQSQLGYVGMFVSQLTLPDCATMVHLDQTGGKSDSADIYTGGTVNGKYDLDAGLVLYTSNPATDPGWSPYSFPIEKAAPGKPRRAPVALPGKPQEVTINGHPITGSQRVMMFGDVSMSFCTGGQDEKELQNIVALHFYGNYQFIIRGANRAIVAKAPVSVGAVTLTAWATGWNYKNRDGMVIKRVNSIAQNIEIGKPETPNGDHVYGGAWNAVTIQSALKGNMDWVESLEVTNYAGGHPYPSKQKVWSHPDLPFFSEDHINLSTTPDIALPLR